MIRCGLQQERMLSAGERALKLAGHHYDTVPDSPGADDNASGVAWLIGLARTLAPSL